MTHSGKNATSSNGNTSGEKKSRSNNTSPSQAAQRPQRQEQQQSGSASSTTAPPKQPNAWSKPLQTKSAANASSGGSNNSTNGTNGNSKSSATNSSKTSSGAGNSASTTTSPPPGYKARESTMPSSSTKQSQTPASSNSQKAFSSNGEEELKNRDRSLHMFLVLLGHKVVCHLKSGVVLEGILRTSTPFATNQERHSFVYLLMRTRVLSGDKSNIKPGATVTVPMDQVIQMHIPQVKFSTLLQNSKAPGGTSTTSGSSSGPNGFADGEISGGRHSDKLSNDRSLQAAGSAWTSGSGPGTSLSASSAPRLNKRAEALQGKGGGGGNATGGGGGGGGLQGSIGAWDQFQANETLFNVHASYDETVYTTPLDKSQLDASKIKRAEQLAKEIEAAPSANVHLQQERNQSVMGDYDEEDLHSGVVREVKTPTGNASNGKASESKGSANTSKKSDDSAASGNKKTTSGSDQTPMNYAKAVQQKQTLEAEKQALEAEDKKKDEIETEKNTELEGKEEAPVTETAQQAQEEKVKDAVPPTPDETKTAATSISSATKEDGSIDTSAAAAESTEDEKHQTGQKQSASTGSKLNANAKEFRLNINAKSFTPSFAAPAPPPPEAHAQPPQQQQQHHHHPGSQPQQPYDMMVPPPQFIPANAHMGQHGMFLVYLLWFVGCSWRSRSDHVFV